METRGSVRLDDRAYVVADLDQSFLDTWHQRLTNDVVPRGPDVGCHVAPRYWLCWPLQKKFELYKF
jgi:hypothetical protein